jgi:glycerol uptake facilitator protein
LVLVFFLAELLGTMTMVVLGNGVVANVLLDRSKGQNSGWVVITAGWACAVMCGTLVSCALGGPGWLNPAVALAALFQPGPALLHILAGVAGELAGAFLGAILVFLGYLPHWAVTEEPELKLAVFATGPAIRSAPANCLTEGIATFVLVILFLAIRSMPFASGIAPLAIGCIVWGIGLSLGGPTAFALNPARDLGPRLAHALLPIPGKGGSDWGYAWIPVVAPLLGGAAAATLWASVAKVP